MLNQTDIKKILVLGSGPDLIGQGSEYNSATALACRYLRANGYRVIVADINPAALATQPGLADQVYLEPLTVASLKKIIAREKPEALLVTCGGQTVLNLGYLLEREGILDQNQARFLGITATAIENCEDRNQLRKMLGELEIKIPNGSMVTTISAGMDLAEKIGLPLVVRSAFAPEGAGVHIAYNLEELELYLEKALKQSPIRQAAVEESLLGWQEFSYEILRDHSNQIQELGVVEEIDPVGVHSGDSMAVFPAISITPEISASFFKYAKKISKALGVAGVVNVQFARNPVSGEIVVIEVNPRLTVNAALMGLINGISLATVATALALGAPLADLIEESESKRFRLSNQVVFTAPSFDLHKFSAVDPILTTSMKATGRVVACGGDFKEAFQKGLNSVLANSFNVNSDLPNEGERLSPSKLKAGLINPQPQRIIYLRQALQAGMKPQEVHELSSLPIWFLEELAELLKFEKTLTTYALYNLTPEIMRQAKKWGFSDHQLANLLNTTEEQLRDTRRKMGVLPEKAEVNHYLFNRTCHNRLSYLTYHHSDAHREQGKENKAVILGVGPNRIGSGSEGIYTLKETVEAFNESGYLAIVLDNNPAALMAEFSETAEYYCGPLNTEELLAICEFEQPRRLFWETAGQDGLQVITGMPKSLLMAVGVDLAAIKDLIDKLESKGVRPDLSGPDVLAVEAVLVSDRTEVVLCGLMEQIEAAEINSGDSAFAMPPYNLSKDIFNQIKANAVQTVKETHFNGLIKLRYFIKNSVISLATVETWPKIEVPVIEKATGMAWFKVAVKARLENNLGAQVAGNDLTPKIMVIKEAVLPFDRFPGVDVWLGSEMRATGMVLGTAGDFGSAFIKSQLAAGVKVPASGRVFVSIKEIDRRVLLPLLAQLTQLGFKIMANDETAGFFRSQELSCQTVFDPGEGRPNILDFIKNAKIDWIISTYSGAGKAGADLIRSIAVQYGIPITTTVAGAKAAVKGLTTFVQGELPVNPLT